MNEALRECGYPEWALHREKQQRKEDKEQCRGKVIIPYVKKLSEKVARVLKKRNPQTNPEVKELCMQHERESAPNGQSRSNL